MTCDRCGLEDGITCLCYVSELEKRIEFLEEELDKLTDVVNVLSRHTKNALKILTQKE